MQFRSSILMAGMLSASLFCAENLTQTNIEQAQANAATTSRSLAAALLDYGSEVGRFVSAHAVGIRGDGDLGGAQDCDEVAVGRQ